MGWRVYSWGGGAAAIVGFFLPWATVSSSANLGALSGGVPSTANTFTVTGAQTGGIFLILACLVVVFSFAVAKQRTAAMSILITGVLGAAGMLISWQNLTSLSKNPLFDGSLLGVRMSVSLGIGFWLTSIGLVGIVCGGIVGVRESSARSEPVMTDVPPPSASPS